MGQHMFNSVSSTLTPVHSNSSACSVNMLSVQRNVLSRMSVVSSGTLLWVEGGGWRSEQLSLCSHLEILLPSAVALCQSDHTCLRLLTPQQLNTTYTLNTVLDECASMNLSALQQIRTCHAIIIHEPPDN